MFTEHDMKILAYIDSAGDASKPNILKRFGKSALARFQRLEHEHIIEMTTIPDGSGGYVFTGGYSISSKGYMLIEDYRSSSKKTSNRLLEYRAYQIIPIVISSIALIKSFWPEIMEILQTLSQALYTK